MIRFPQGGTMLALLARIVPSDDGCSNRVMWSYEKDDTGECRI